VVKISFKHLEHRILITITVLFCVMASLSSLPSQAANDQRQTLSINTDWNFKMRGSLQVEHTAEGLLVSTDDLRLSVLDSYKIVPITVRYLTVDLVNRSPGQKGWNKVGTTKNIPLGTFNVKMTHGDSLGAKFNELIPKPFSETFDYGNHWLVLTVHVTTRNSNGTVHAHTPQRLTPPAYLKGGIAVASNPSNVSKTTSVPAEKIVLFVTTPNVKWGVTSTAKGRIWTDGPFLRIALDEHTARVDPKFVKTATKLVGFKVELTTTEANGVWRTVRSSDRVDINTTVFRDDVRKIPPSEFRIPIEGIPLNTLAEYGLVLTTLVGDNDGRTYSHSPSRIGQLRID
jgi:hypothetical protein